MKNRFVFAFFVLNFVCVARFAVADGLSTPFADVQLEEVPVGIATPVNSVAGEGLLVHNLGNAPVQVRIEVLQPAPADLRGGAVPIPDVHWIKIVPDGLDVPANGEGRCQVTLIVPAQRRYRHKYYQATIWSHGLPVDGRGLTVSAGLLSRLRFRTK